MPDAHEGHLCGLWTGLRRGLLVNGLESNRCIGEYAGEAYHDFIKAFYLRSGVDYAKRWDSDPIPDILDSVPQIAWPPVGKRVFVHDDPARGFRITRLDRRGTFFPPFTGNALEYAQILISAEEIHVIDSVFFCLANQLPVQGQLFYHWYARPDRRNFRYELRKEWSYLQ
jgi:hypothetical protein